MNSALKNVGKIIGAVAAIALITAVPAHAALPDSAQVAVKYSDLDLSSPEGRATLEGRIERAARQICRMDGPTPTGSRLPTNAMRECYKKATESIDEHIAHAVEKRERKS